MQTEHSPAVLPRTIAWFIVAGSFLFVLSCVTSYVFGLPGVADIVNGTSSPIVYAPLIVYAAFFLLAFAFANRTSHRSLRQDAEQISAIVDFLVRACFWAVLLVGLADAFLSFLRVEELLPAVVGEQLTNDLGRSQFRGPYIHIPLIGLAVLIAAVTRGLGFIWLSLLVVVAELGIVFSRFVFSYEQAFQGDLVRFWYGALFLFASAYTLVEEGHVRVDVLYAGMSQRARGYVNFWGSLLMGVSLTVVILSLGTWTQASVIIGPLLNYEVSQSGFGMYVKYLMAGFLGVFGISMLIQFAGYMLSAVADIRGEPGGRDPAESTGH